MTACQLEHSLTWHSLYVAYDSKKNQYNTFKLKLTDREKCGRSI